MADTAHLSRATDKSVREITQKFNNIRPLGGFGGGRAYSPGMAITPGATSSRMGYPGMDRRWDYQFPTTTYKGAYFGGASKYMNKFFQEQTFNLRDKLAGFGGKIKTAFSGIGGRFSSFFGNIFRGGKTADATTASFGGLSDIIKKTGFGALRAKNAFGLLGGVLQKIPGWAKAAVAAFFGLREAFKHGMLVEGSKIIFETLTGSMERASKLITGSRRYSVLTPFTPEEVLGATTTSIQYGIKPFEKGGYGLAPGKTAMDIFAGLGSMINPLTGAALGINRMATAVLRGDYRLLRPVRGIVNPAYEAAKATGYKVGTPEFNEKFINELGKIPAIMQLAERHSTSVKGLWSTISGMWEEFWMDFTGAGEQRGVLTFWSQIRDILLDIRDSILPAYEKIQPAITEFGARVGSVLKMVYNIAKEILPALALSGIVKFVKILRGAKAFLPGLGGSLLTIFKFAYKLFPVFRILKLLVISEFIKPFIPLLMQVARILNQVGIFVSTTLTRAFQFLVKVVEAFARIFFGTRIEDMTSKLNEFVTGLQMFVQWWGVYVDLIFSKLEARINKAVFAVKEFLSNMRGLLLNLAGFMKDIPLPGRKLWQAYYNKYVEEETPEQKKVNTMVTKRAFYREATGQPLTERDKAAIDVMRSSLEELRNPMRKYETGEYFKSQQQPGEDYTDYLMRLQGVKRPDVEVLNRLDNEMQKQTKILRDNLNEIKNGDKTFIDKKKINKMNNRGLNNSARPSMGY
jgi:hypothetical protein